MVELVQLQAVAYVAQILGVIGTLTAAFIAVRSYINANKRAEEARARELETRQLQLFMNIYQTHISKTFQHDVEQIHHVWEWKDLDDYLSKYGAIHPEEQSMMSSVFMTYDGMGALVKRGLVNPELVYDLLNIQAVETWEKFKPLINDIRTKFNVPHAFEYYEYLYNLMEEIRKRRGQVKTDLSGLDLSFQKEFKN